MSIINNENDLNKMRSACKDAAKILDFITSYVKPGVTTRYLDKLCLEYLTNELKVKSATIGYAPQGHSPFPGSICTSVNHQVCHGIPNDKILKNGDSLNIDVTIIKDGWYGDTSRMYHIGDQSIQSLRLSEITYECMWKGIQKVKNSVRLGDIGHAIQKHAEEAGFSVVREFCGHGIGRKFHEDPQVLHYGKPNTGEILRTGMLFTIEPMINAGKKEIKQLSDGWTIVTKDHSLSAQWEHTICVTDDGYEVLTLSPGAPKPPSFIDNQDIF
ncbi:methionyl aminopeptidase [Candidatus Kinetoplastibacterium blastocrithidii TCC012E]|uniref:Methionine aminopeptidase n=2 Tax=cellular organisms TaxID=131567 RepID=S9VPL4_9TRYP|nr:type I methionyl aminopeptidase [Candidatus Kinetoplastibacterium blastocrithidii]EPY28996.1 methionyl aminopeptidase [Strigomonas culicis]AFZ83628.1 methionyl aminopeptidase [Candidatus Kinetoplastibacterium blastocrithidii (ex Strigomonas culicis)]AGF49749.1 methionyl aminopeptidase [Candidatus Kinetoplastibacterium blastocrithidii TCC012E]EPY29621.1 methionyl aminopeptidase [Strigomonas culicis]EPY34436.1 methionyl aminopeptidase [Strigomonas culicis]|eukprot:EPY28996.1 methionyl aminopeptidase [Strigomonas culicis]